MRRKKSKKKWRFYWKNIGTLGRINRMVAGILLLVGAMLSIDKKIRAALLASIGVVMLVDGYFKWCPLRAVLKRPTRSAYRRHYPKK